MVIINTDNISNHDRYTMFNQMMLSTSGIIIWYSGTETAGTTGVYPTQQYGFIRGSYGSISPEKNPDLDRLYSSWNLSTGLPNFSILGIKPGSDPGAGYISKVKVDGTEYSTTGTSYNWASGTGLATWQWNSTGIITSAGAKTITIYR